MSIRLAKALEPYYPMFIEEPVLPGAVDELARVARSTSIPIATGERLFTKWEFRPVLEAGAAAVLSSRSGNDAGTLYVQDTLKALHDIAAAYRKKFDIKVAAITGSVGKTTTKEMIASVLSEFAPTLKTEGNLNNLVGLPLSVLRIGSGHRAAVHARY
jgi:UDP-N-acetylmuramoyl-tripeptide--D-alanyl-D-alanine ligase